MQNVLLIIYRLYGGGAERVVSNLSQALENKYNIHIALFGDEERTYPYKGELIRIKLPFSRNPIRNNKLKRAIRFFLLTRKLKEIKTKYDIDVAVSFGEQANITNVLSAKKEKICLSMRTTLSKEMQTAPKMQVLSRLIKKYYNKADTIIVPSQLAANDLISSFDIERSKVQMIHNYIDPEFVNKLAKESFEDDSIVDLFKKQILLNVGRITPAKGQWLLFHAYKKLKPDYPDIRIVIIGDSESELEFKIKLVSYAKQLDLKLFDKHSPGQKFSLDYDVYLLGFDANPFRFMMRSELLVFSSTYEGFPNTMIEAMESKLAIVAADCQSGPREILAPKTNPSQHTSITEFASYGVLAPALPSSSIDDPVSDEIVDEWRKAISIMLNDANLRTNYISKGQQRAAAFEKKIILKQWEALLKNDKVKVQNFEEKESATSHN